LGRELKGLAGSVRAWAALRPSSIDSRFEALRAVTTPLVGRNEEIELLLRRWEQAKGGDGCAVLISGEPGIGKSRIAQTVVERLANDPHIRLRYFCSPHHQDSALYPSITQLERAAGFRREDTDEKRLSKLETVLAQATNDLGEVVPLMADLLSIPTRDRYPPLNLSPQKRKQKILQAQLAQIEGLAARQPVLMVFEDIHWSDPTTLESLDLLIDRLPNLGVLAILTFRPEFAPPWIGRPHLALISLNRLSPRQRAEMIVHLTGGKALPKDITDQIVDRTDGVPLFIEELTKTVVESGIVTETAAGYATTGPVAPLAIPTSLHASLLARLDRLAPTREVAQIGAALGRQFTHELISAVALMPQQKVDEALALLADAELIFRRGSPPNAEYTFKHALVRDAAYGTLLRSSRQQLHSRIAAVLERQFPEAVTATPEVLAQHHTAAGAAAQAIPCWLKAGQAALQRSALTESASHLKQGLGLLQSISDESARDGLELGLQAALALTLSTAKGYAVPEVESAYKRARALCDKIGETPQLFPVLYGLFVFYWVRGNLQSARQSAEEMLSTASAAQDQAMLLVAHSALGNVTWYMGENHVALDNLLRAEAIYDEPAHASLTVAYGQDFGVFTLGHLDLAQLTLGYPNKGAQAGSALLTLARRLNHPFSLCAALFFHTLSLLRRRDPAGVLKVADECIVVSTEQGFAHWAALGMVLKGWAMTQFGSKGDEGISLVRQGIAAWQAVGARLALSWIHVLLAESELIEGHADAALEATDKALIWMGTNDERQIEGFIRCCRGDVFRSLGNVKLAHEEYKTSIDVARQQGGKFWELRPAISLARLWRDQGKREEARELLAPVYGWFTEGFDTRDLKEAKALLEELNT
jgi:predicted ATPase